MTVERVHKPVHTIRQRSDVKVERMPAAMKVLMEHIYEYQKGVRQMVLYTFNKRYTTFATSRLEHQNIDYLLQPIEGDSVNLYFGKPECLNAVRLFADKPLWQLTPEEDFILGAVLGYDIGRQCERYCERKGRRKCEHCQHVLTT